MKTETKLVEYSFPDTDDIRGLEITFKDDVFYLNCVDLDEGNDLFSIPFPSLKSAKMFAKTLLLASLDELFS